MKPPGARKNRNEKTSGFFICQCGGLQRTTAYHYIDAAHSTASRIAKIESYTMGASSIPLRRWIFLVFACCLGALVNYALLSAQASEYIISSEVMAPLGLPGISSASMGKFTIIIISMDRFSSLNRLLSSLKETDYLSDEVNLVIRFDLPKRPTPQWRNQVDAFRENLVWNTGSVKVVVAEANMGLRRAWLEAWKPGTDSEYAIILEDDIEVSPVWYKWLKGALLAYQSRTDLAGISLQRQSLVPLKKAKNKHISDNGGKPFLYKLVGSIGYSPVAKVWLDFLDFAECALATKMKIDTPELVTSDWYNSLDQRTMWTQLFIFFCKYRKLSTLYVFPRNYKTLAAHWREKGVHFHAAAGRDFELANAEEVCFDYPSDLVKLDWDARPQPSKTRPIRSVILSGAVGYSLEEFKRFVTSLREHYYGDVSLLISYNASPEIRELLTQYDIHAVETKEKGGIQLSESWNRINQLRWNFYEEVCSSDSYDVCMAVDFRDTIFQDDPFLQVSVKGGNVLYVYEHRMLMNEWHLERAYECKKTNDAIRGKRIINAGGFLATPGVFPKLIDIIQNFGEGCDDQVALNLGIYSGRLEDTHVVFHSQGTGSINNVAFGGVYRQDSRKRFLNHNCFPAPAVPQFDKAGT